jgi:hypothetical protein
MSASMTEPGQKERKCFGDIEMMLDADFHYIISSSVLRDGLKQASGIASLRSFYGAFVGKTCSHGVIPLWKYSRKNI